ncbi:MAG: hypothetical protein ACU85U_21340, partial [Gammaproteobacteria bacterium]
QPGRQAMLINILKVVGVLLLLVLLVAVWLFYTRVYNYERFSLEVDKTRFPEVKTEADVDQLAEHLLAQMTLDEKIEQLYGEGRAGIIKLAANLFWLRRFPHMYIAPNERLGKLIAREARALRGRAEAAHHVDPAAR